MLDTYFLDRIKVRFVEGSYNNKEAIEFFIGCAAPEGAITHLDVTSLEIRAGKAYRSISEGIFDAIVCDRQSFSKEIEQNFADAQGHSLASITFVVEDASPDTVVSIILLALMIEGKLFDVETFRVLVDQTTQWEIGIRPDPFPYPGVPEWTTLLSALAHQIFETDKDFAITIPEAVHRGLKILSIAIESPDNWRGKNAWKYPDVQRALSALKNEKLRYQELFQNALILEGALPLIESKSRIVTVSILFVVEDQPLGLLSDFARNDSNGSPSGQGFDIVIVHRPSAPAMNQYTIVQKTTTGTDLTPIHTCLENAEKIKSKLSPTYREPWYLSRNKDIIGSPGKASNSVGTALSYSQFKKVVWGAVNPLRSTKTIAVAFNEQNLEFTDISLLDSSSLISSDKGIKSVRFLCWQKSEHKISQPLIMNETTERLLATLASGAGSLPVDTYENLLPIGSFETVQLSGGFVIVSPTGIIIIDDWREKKLDAENLLQLTLQISDWDTELQTQLQEVSEASAAANRWLRETSNGGNIETPVFIDGLKVKRANFTSDIISARARFGAAKSAFISARPDDTDSSAIFAACRRLWRHKEREQLVEKGFEDAEHAINAVIAIRRTNVLQLFSSYVFTAYVSGVVSKLFVDAANDIFIAFDLVLFHGKLGKALLSLAYLASFLTFTIIIILLVRQVIRILDPTVNKLTK